MIRLGLVPVLAVMLAAPLAAQQVNPAVTADRGSGSRWLVHYGKWLGAALAVTFTVMGAREDARSDDAYRQLVTACRIDPTKCTLNSGGTYTNPVSENLYQASTSYARSARARLIAGQVTLLLTVGMFLADRGGKTDGPDNIPYELTVEPRGNGARVGMRFKF
jgi:hypothetical protein